MSKEKGDKTLTSPWGETAGRTVRKEVRLTPEENKEYTEHAESMNRSWSDWARYSMEKMRMFDKLLYDEFPQMIEEAVKKVMKSSDMVEETKEEIHPSLKKQYDLLITKLLTEHAIIMSLLQSDGFLPLTEIYQSVEKFFQNSGLDFDEMIYRDRIVVLNELNLLSFVDTDDDTQCHLSIARSFSKTIETLNQKLKDQESE